MNKKEKFSAYYKYLPGALNPPIPLFTVFEMHQYRDGLLGCNGK